MPEQTAVEAIKARLQTLTGEARSGGTKDMAELVGIPLGTVHRYVRGPGVPAHDFLVAVADRYNVSLDWLYGRSESGGLKDAEQAEPAWARRLDARLRFLERQVTAIAEARSPSVSGEIADPQLRQLVTEMESRVQELIAASPTPLVEEDPPAVAGAQGEQPGTRR